ncbi:MAG: CpsD/CapB family tyrosine-protein kinase [Sarcina sp.]
MFIVEKDPHSKAAEAYRTIRTNIKYSSYDKKLQVIVVTSGESKDGKTTVAGNLAISFSQDNKKAILIDCNLRHPSVRQRLELTSGVGLTEVIIGEENLKNVVQKYNNEIDVLVSGKVPPNPSELLGSDSMKHLIDKAKEEYDYVILDTPAVLSYSDAQILSTMADGVILVVKANSSKIDSAMKAKLQLDRVNAHIIGSILCDEEIKDKAKK